jgi:hypothetical protein
VSPWEDAFSFREKGTLRRNYSPAAKQQPIQNNDLDGERKKGDLLTGADRVPVKQL